MVSPDLIGDSEKLLRACNILDFPSSKSAGAVQTHSGAWSTWCDKISFFQETEFSTKERTSRTISINSTGNFGQSDQPHYKSMRQNKVCVVYIPSCKLALSEPGSAAKPHISTMHFSVTMKKLTWCWVTKRFAHKDHTCQTLFSTSDFYYSAHCRVSPAHQLGPDEEAATITTWSRRAGKQDAHSTNRG